MCDCKNIIKLLDIRQLAVNRMTTLSVMLGVALSASSNVLHALPTEYVANKYSGETILIAVRANRGAAKAIKRWQPTIDYLNNNMPGYHFRMLPFEINSTLNQAASRNEFHFILTNPASYVELEKRYGAQHLLTLTNKRQGKGYTQFGSVIFTLKDRDNINSITDLSGKSFMGADELGFGGWRVAWREMLKHDVNPYKDFSRLTFGGGIQQNVVYAVLNKQADAGSVRTDMLERMAKAGDINLHDFKILNQKHTDGFPFYHSTDLYPEWPFAKLSHTYDTLAEQVARTLLNIKTDSKAARIGKYEKWHSPLSYQPVNDLLQELKIGPYAQSKPEFQEIIIEYWRSFLLLLVSITILFALLARFKFVNKKLARMEHALLATNESLKDLTLIDTLTGLGNRRKLNDHFEQVWGQLCRDGSNVCVLLMDIDYFKNYNDLHGHIAGDACLKKIAETINTVYRRSDELCIRYGGEEFLILCRKCDIEALLKRTDEFHKAITALNIPHGASEAAAIVSVSVGIAQITAEKDAKPEDLIHKADMAMYQAKSAGRNQTVVYKQTD